MLIYPETNRMSIFILIRLPRSENITDIRKSILFRNQHALKKMNH